MGPNPAKYRLRLSRLPGLRPKLTPTTAEEPAGLPASGPPSQQQRASLEQGSSGQQGEQPAVSLEEKCNQKRAESDFTWKPGSGGQLIRREVEAKARPKPGDLIQIFRVGYEHWAIYMEDDCVVHLAPPSEEFQVGSITSVFSHQAVVKYSRLEDVLHGCSWTVNNRLDGTYSPLPVAEIVGRTKKMVNQIVQYSLFEGNCEHFVNGLRYGVPRSQQAEHLLREGARAAGAIISAIVDSINPKPLTA